MIEQIGIVGAGTMGNGIAQVCAAAGLPVVMTDISDAALTRGMSVVSNSLERLVNKQKMTDADRQAALARITTSTDTAKFSTCDLVIEAATENEDLKIKILKDLCAKLQPRALLATNTSSISITKLAAATDRPDRFIGLHFFNPVPLMALLELIRGLQTSDDTHAKAEAFSKQIGKVSITAKNSPGFAVNRILCPMINEAIFALQEGIATAEDLDAGMKLGCNHPIGPLALADMIGLDTMLSVMEVFYEGFNDPKYRPAPLLEGNGRRRPSRPQDRAGVLQLRQVTLRSGRVGEERSDAHRLSRAREWWATLRSAHPSNQSGKPHAYCGCRRRRRRRRVWRGAGEGRRRRHLHCARRASRRHEARWPEGSEPARRHPSGADAGDRQSRRDRRGRYRAVLRQAVGRRKRGRGDQAAGRPQHRGHPAAERHRCGRAAAADPRAEKPSWAASRRSAPRSSRPA